MLAYQSWRLDWYTFCVCITGRCLPALWWLKLRSFNPLSHLVLKNPMFVLTNPSGSKYILITYLSPKLHPLVKKLLGSKREDLTCYYVIVIINDGLLGRRTRGAPVYASCKLLSTHSVKCMASCNGPVQAKVEEAEDEKVCSWGIQIIKSQH